MENNIFLNLKESTYISEIDNAKFYFSRAISKERFEKSLNEYILSSKRRLRRIFGDDFDCENYLLAILHYKEIEKNGFYITLMDNIGSEYHYESCRSLGIYRIILDNATQKD